MLPYHEIAPLQLGPLTIYPFGFLAAVALMVGMTLAERRASVYRLNPKVVAAVLRWAVICGFIGAHLVSAIFYFPERIRDNPLYLLKIWDGISSMGGFIGGALGVIYCLHASKARFWSYCDSIMYGLAFAWIFGRLGCTVAFDHPGALTDFFLAMPYPSGHDVSEGIRHNLGFYELLWACAVCGFFSLQRNKTHREGYYLFVFAIAYMPFRFVLDFLRADDKRYLGLTAAQYATVGVFFVALYFFRKIQTEGRLLEPNPLPQPLPRPRRKR